MDNDKNLQANELAGKTAVVTVAAMATIAVATVSVVLWPATLFAAPFYGVSNSDWNKQSKCFREQRRAELEAELQELDRLEK